MADAASCLCCVRKYGCLCRHVAATGTEVYRAAPPLRLLLLSLVRLHVLLLLVRLLLGLLLLLVVLLWGQNCARQKELLLLRRRLGVQKLLQQLLLVRLVYECAGLLSQLCLL